MHQVTYTIMVHIYTCNEVVTSDIKIHIEQPLRHYNKDFYYVHVKNGGLLPLYLQVCDVFVKSNPIIYDDGYVTMDVEMSEVMKTCIDKVETCIIKKVMSKYMQGNEVEKLQRTSHHMRLRNFNVQSIQCYDMHKNVISMHDVAARDVISLIVKVDKFVYTSYVSYIHYSIVQLLKERHAHVPPYALLPVVTCNADASPISYDVQKYTKMKKLGIPEGALRQKMTMDGVSLADIDAFFSMKHAASPPPPPPPPPPPLPFGHKPREPSAHASMAQILMDIKNGNFALKKQEQQHQKQSSKAAKVLRCVDTSRKVPSLEEIQGALKKLRKINYNDG